MKKQTLNAVVFAVVALAFIVFCRMNTAIPYL